MSKVYGLREKIKNANSKEEIDELLKTGKNFEFASVETKRAWISTSKFRLAQLSSNNSAQTPETPVKTEKRKITKKK